MFHYADKPEPARVPYAYIALSRNGSLRDPEQAGVYVGFLAGALRSAGPHADRLLVQLTALPHEDQWVVVRALAFSGLPDWPDLMRRLEPHFPGRADMARAYLDGSLPTLDQIHREDEQRSRWQDFKDWLLFRRHHPAQHHVSFENAPELLDTLWGLYFATEDTTAIERIIALLPWSNDRERVSKLTIGNMARFMLADNAMKSRRLLELLKTMRGRQPKEAEPILGEVVRAAETVDVGYLRKDALAAIEDLKKQGPNSSRNIAWWGQVGEGAIAIGCLGAAASGAGAAIGIPCVIGGAMSSAGIKMLAAP
jgi:hypothetical protein